MRAGLREKTCIVTGATNGIGRSAALALACEGAELVIVGRDPRKGEATVETLMRESGNPEIELLVADFASQKSIRSAARTFLESGRPLHILLNNAGAVFARREETEDGLEATFAVNHLGYFLWTRLLLRRLCQSAPARIVNVASHAHRNAGPALDFSDLQSRESYAAMRAYGKSKLANLLFTRELARRLEGMRVTANAMHPGFVATGLGANNGWLARWIMNLARPFVRTPEKGAETAVYLCASPDVDGVTGLYFRDCKPVAPAPAATRDNDADRLWELSEELTGLTAHEELAS